MGLSCCFCDGGAEVPGRTASITSWRICSAKRPRISDSGTLPERKARDARHLLITFGDCPEIAGNFVSGDFDFNFSRAIRVQGRRRVGVVVALMVMPGRFFGGGRHSAGLRCGFDHFG